MLTSFFGKSTPVNIIAVVIFMAAFFVFANFDPLIADFNLLPFLEKLAVLVIFLLSVLVLNFIAQKNELTKRSAYKILLFAVFATSFPALLKNDQAIIANFFILLSFRRIISLKSRKVVQKKIFDATFWICIASLYYFWSILFLIVVFAGIVFYAAYIKNFLIPIIAFLAVALVTECAYLLVYESFYHFSDWFQPMNFQFENYQDLALLVPLSIILAVLIWTMFFYFSVIQKASITRRPVLNLVMLSLGTAICIAMLSHNKNGSEFIFFFVPLSIIASNYFGNKKDRIFKEILLLLLILMPLCIPFIF
ncbi:DUF6427 family protein [Salegentibacter sp. F188]|uniref:DUF6427 family protein n=1 Tax=Autumnicola patrickiae TaxID=3075591 RepID=A0ABU3E0Z1_9FLAO|nr:DUF6427 family protein [Salegentibacter sp. F188]MDT0689631.1 DUF6427 family protein [Salegentibacter sp. F188]